MVSACSNDVACTAVTTEGGMQLGPLLPYSDWISLHPNDGMPWWTYNMTQVGRQQCSEFPVWAGLDSAMLACACQSV